MAKIRPFKALRFNTEKAGAIETLCSPPYDIVDDCDRLLLLRKNQYNIIRLEKPIGEKPYEYAASLLKEWKQEGILKRDSENCYYVYREEFSVAGKNYAFTGFMTELEALPFSEGVVLPHEETLSKAKQDRFNLFKATNCHFSQIYVLFNDEKKTIEEMLEDITAKSPYQSFTDDEGVTHSLWIVSDEKTTSALTKAFEDKKLYVADGHHRYETSVNFKNYQKENGRFTDSGNYTLAMLVSMESDGLVVFPTHRIVKELEDFSRETVLSSAKKYFDITEISENEVETQLNTLYNEGKNAFVMFSGEKFDLFVLTDNNATREIYPDKSSAYCGLDVTILHSLVLEETMKIDKENMANQKNLNYTRDIEEAIDRVKEGRANCSFILNPTKVSEIRDVALAGEKMPQKSTYFYPKLITGLVMHDFGEF